MPTILKVNGFRFFFYSDEGDPLEPIHVHVVKGEANGKVWLEPNVELVYARGFNSKEISEIMKLILQNKALIERVWHEHFGV